MVTVVYCLIVKFFTFTQIKYIKANQVTIRQCHIQSLQLSKQAVTKPDKVITRDVLAIEQDRSGITLDSLDPQKDYPKPESVERTVEVQIGREGQVTQIGSLLNMDQKREM